ncbi:MAG: tetratricopeptide repeat protein [Anaerolineales bacterium]|nr:tetratricopeptide repeat protein [Anaerolineales bacterium]
MDTLIEDLRPRALHIVALVVAILVLGPTPVFRIFDEHYQAARTAAASGQYKAAFEQIETLLAIQPDMEMLHVPAAETALAAGLTQEAQQHLQVLKTSSIKSPSWSCLQAESLIINGEIERAFEEVQLEIGACPQLEFHLRSWILQWMEQGKYQHAEAAMIRLLGIIPSDPDLHYKYGIVTASHDPEKALASLRLADDLSPNGHEDAQYLIRIIEDARVAASPAYTLGSVGQVFAGQGEWALAIQAFQNAIAIEPTYVDALAYLGYSLDEIGEDGIDALRAAVRVDSKQALPHLYLGIHWLRHNNPDRALQEFEKAARLDADNPTIAAQIGEAYSASGDPASAIAAYRVAAELVPDIPTFWVLLAQMSLSHEYNIGEVALPAARNAVALNPQDPAALDALGYSHYLLGNLDDAERFIHRSILLDPMRPVTQYHFGMLKAIMGESDAALAAFRLAYHLDPEGWIGDIVKGYLEDGSL